MKICIKANHYEKQASLLRKTLEKRIDVEFASDGMSIELDVADTWNEKESYQIAKIENGYKITGSDELGLYYGIGKFLHTAVWSETEFVPNPPTKEMIPACEFRATYYSVHFFNWYHKAPTAELEEYLESMLLWGYNTIICILPIVCFENFDDPVFHELRTKTREIYQIAKKYGMRIGTMINPNQGLITTPAEYAADPSCYDVRSGGVGKNVCPEKPGAMEYLRKLWLKVFEQYEDIGLDYVFTWPYDEGGCGCEACSPWGANGFLKISHETFMDAKQFFPNVKFVLSTWYMDDTINGQYDFGEFEGLYKRLKEDMSYVDYILVDSRLEYPRYPLEHEIVKPIINFPEISMWGLYSWGGRGANPLLKRFQRLWDDSKKVLSGGMPYSEGLYEDISKVQWSGFYWDPDQPYQEIMKEYISYEYSPAVVDEAIEMMELIEANHVLVADYQEPDRSLSDHAAELAEWIDSKLSKQNKLAWRWRILYIRAKIDKIIYDAYWERYRGEENAIYDMRFTKEYYFWDNEKAQDLLQELCRIYHSIDKVPYSNTFGKVIEDPGRNRWTFPPVKGGKVR
jgi:hypothetical protein